MRNAVCIFLLGAVAIALVGAAAPAQPTTTIKIIRTVPHTQGYGSGLAWMNETLWVGDAFGSAIQQHDPYTSTMIKSIVAPNSKVRDLTWDGKQLWMASWFTPPTPSIYALDANSGSVIASYVAPFSSGHSDGMAWDGASLWISDEVNQIHQCDPKNKLAIIKTIPVPAAGAFNPRGLAWDTGVNAIWAGYQSANWIRKHNPADGKILEQFTSPYGAYQQGLTWDSWFLWATGGSSQKDMTQIDVHPPFVIMKGALKPGTSIQFELSGAVNETGNVFVVGWSGSGTQGFNVGGKTIHLTFDNFTVLGLALFPFFSNTVDGNGTSFTALFPWPAVPKGIPFWTCGVTLDSNGVVSVNEPVKYVSE